MQEAPFQALDVLFLHLVEPLELFGLGVFQQGRGGRRGNRQGHDEGSSQTVADAHGHGLQQALDDTRCEDDGQEHADRGKGGSHDGHAHLLGALDRRAGSGHAAAAQTVDVLDDDDGVVHQHTNAEGQARQRHNIHIQTGEVHEHHGKQHRQRDTDADHQRGLDILEEDGQHDDGKGRTDEHTAQDAADDDADVVALVGQHDHMQAIVFLFQLLEGSLAVAGNFTGAGRIALEDLQHHGALAVQAGKAVLRVVNDLHIGHVRQADIAKAIHMEQQGTGDILDAVVLLADLQQPGLVAGILDITGGHGEVLGIDQLCQRVNIQHLGHVGVLHGHLLGILVLLLGIFQLLLVIVQHLAGLGELDIGLQLLLGIAAHDLGELIHQAGHVVHGLDGALQRVINVAQALLHLQIIDQLPGRCAGGVALRVQALLQILQSGGQLIGDIAQLRHDLDQRIDILHSGLIELVHDPLQAVPHIDQGLLDLRLVDHGNELVDALQKGLCLLLDQHEGILQFAGILAVDGIADQLVVIGQLGLVLLSACLDLGLCSIQLGLCIGQLHVNDFQQLFIDGIDLFLIELHLHHPGDQAIGGNIGNAALTLDIGDHGVVDEIGQLIGIAALAADGHGHKGVHVQGIFNDGGGHAGAWQAGGGLIHLVGHLDHGTVHVRIVLKLHQQQTVVFCRGGGNVFHARDGAQRTLHHVGDLVLHTLRAGTGIDRDHHQVRCVHVWQQVGLHVLHGHKAQHDDHDDCNQNGERFFDAEFFHFFLPFLCFPTHCAAALFSQSGSKAIPLLYTRFRGLQGLPGDSLANLENLL